MSATPASQLHNMDSLGQSLISFLKDYVSSLNPLPASEKQNFIKKLLYIKPAQRIILDALADLHPIITEQVLVPKAQKRRFYQAPKSPLPPVNSLKTREAVEGAQRVLDNFKGIKQSMDSIKTNFHDFKDLEVAVSAQDIREFLQNNEQRESKNEHLLQFLTEMAASEPPIFMDTRDISHHSWHEHVEIQKLIKKESDKLQQKFNKLENRFHYKLVFVKTRAGLHIKRQELLYAKLKQESRLDLERSLMVFNDELSFQHQQKMAEESMLANAADEDHVRDLPSALGRIKKLAAAKRILEKKQALSDKNIRNLENKVKVVTEANKDFKLEILKRKQNEEVLKRALVWVTNNSKLVDASKEKVKMCVDKQNYLQLDAALAELEVSGAQEFLLQKFYDLKEKINVAALSSQDRAVSSKLLGMLDEFKVETLLEESEKKRFQAFVAPPEAPKRVVLAKEGSKTPRARNSVILQSRSFNTAVRPYMGSSNNSIVYETTGNESSESESGKSVDSIDEFNRKLNEEIAQEILKLKQIEEKQRQDELAEQERIRLSKTAQYKAGKGQAKRIPSLKVTSDLNQLRESLDFEAREPVPPESTRDTEGRPDRNDSLALKQAEGLSTTEGQRLGPNGESVSESRESLRSGKDNTFITKMDTQGGREEDARGEANDVAEMAVREKEDVRTAKETLGFIRETPQKSIEGATAISEQTKIYETTKSEEVKESQQEKAKEGKEANDYTKKQVKVKEETDKLDEVKEEAHKQDKETKILDEVKEETNKQDKVKEETEKQSQVREETTKHTQAIQQTSPYNIMDAQHPESRLEQIAPSLHQPEDKSEPPLDNSVHDTYKHHSVITRLQTPPELQLFKEELLRVLLAHYPSSFPRSKLKEILQFPISDNHSIQSLLLSLLSKHLSKSSVPRPAVSKSSVFSQQKFSVSQMSQYAKIKQTFSSTKTPNVSLVKQTVDQLKSEYAEAALQSAFNPLDIWKSLAMQRIVDNRKDSISSHLSKHTGTPSFDTQLKSIVKMIEKNDLDTLERTVQNVPLKLFDPHFFVKKKMTSKIVDNWNRLVNGAMRRKVAKMGRRLALLPNNLADIWFDMAMAIKYVKFRIAKSSLRQSPAREPRQRQELVGWTLKPQRSRALDMGRKGQQPSYSVSPPEYDKAGLETIGVLREYKFPNEQVRLPKIQRAVF